MQRLCLCGLVASADVWLKTEESEINLPPVGPVGVYTAVWRPLLLSTFDSPCSGCLMNLLLRWLRWLVHIIY